MGFRKKKARKSNILNDYISYSRTRMEKTTITLNSDDNEKVEQIQRESNIGKPTKKSVVSDAIEKLHEEVVGDGD